MAEPFTYSRAKPNLISQEEKETSTKFQETPSMMSFKMSKTLMKKVKK